MNAAGDRPSVAIVGGGLAGLAAAVALGSVGCRVELFEARRSLGGRANSFRDPATEELVDLCQHVSMGCCTNLADFCRRTGLDEFFRRDRVINFIGPSGRLFRLSASRWLPAPLHLAPGFWRLRFLARRDRLAIARALWALMRSDPMQGADEPTFGSWLRRHGQSPAAIERFWAVVLTSALGEDLDRASLAAARKVIVDGFLSSRDASNIEVPEAPLGTLYGERLAAWLSERGVAIHRSAPVRQVAIDCSPVVIRADGARSLSDYVVLAVPWNRISDLVSPEIAQRWPWLREITAVDAAPITGVHLWFDRPIMPLQHAVLVGRLSQWIFSRGMREVGDHGAGHYYQVVISASHALAGRERRDVVDDVCRELAAIWPAAAAAELVHWRVVADPAAVFSPRPGLERIRPAQQTAVPGVLVAGDWTATGWPATMESAVRSGYLAAEAITRAAGRAEKFLVPDLASGPLSQLLIKTWPPVASLPVA